MLTARPTLYHLDIFHPLLINQESSFAQYNSSTQVGDQFTPEDVLLQPTRLSVLNMLHVRVCFRSSQSPCLWSHCEPINKSRPVWIKMCQKCYNTIFFNLPVLCLFMFQQQVTSDVTQSEVVGLAGLPVCKKKNIGAPS